MSITRRTAAVVGLISLLMLLISTGVAVLAILGVLVLAAVDAIMVRSKPTASRKIGPLARSLGSDLTINVVKSRFTSRVEVRQPLGPDMAATPSSISYSEQLHCTLTISRRGIHQLLPVAIRQTGPLGLGTWRHTIGESESLRVFADIPTAQKMARAIRLGSIRSVGQTRRGPLGLGTDFESVREYRPDDDVRQINWRATARTGRAMSNNLRIEQDRDLICMVDVGRLSASPFRNDVESWAEGRLANAVTTAGESTDGASESWQSATRLDTLLDAVSAIALVADEVGDRIGTVVFAEDIIRERPPTRQGGAATIESTFDLEAQLIESDPERAAVAIRSPRSALIMVFTDLVDPASARSLVRAIAQLSRRHEVMVLSALDPILREQAVENTPRAEAIRAASTAHQNAISMIYGAGASVVLGLPNQLALVATRAYVDARARPRNITIIQ
jgi:uncharacterized protein (DUF58 family)